jgi:prevent-host-death family protein
MNSFAVSSRDIQRQYADIIQRVRQTKQPAILMSKKEAQAVIVSLEDYEQLQELRRRNSAKNLIAWAQEVRELLKGETLPSDLAARHDYYLWEEATPTA